MDYEISPSNEAMYGEEADEPLTNNLLKQHSIYNMEHADGEPHPNAEEQSTPITTGDCPALGATRIESSPLKNKNRLKQRVQFDDNVAICQKPSTSVQILPFRRAKSDEQTVSQQMRLVSSQEKTPSKQRKKKRDLDISQQLMVTIQTGVVERNGDDADEDTNSERTDASYTRSESNSGEGSEEGAEEEEAEDDKVRGQEFQAQEAMDCDTNKEFGRHNRASNYQDGNGERQPSPRICSNMSLISSQQSAPSDEELFDACGDPPDQHRLKNDVSIDPAFDGDWRPRKPDQGNVAIEVDEDIYDSASPVHGRTKSSKKLSGHRK